MPEIDTTPICGRQVPYSDKVMDIEDLRFWEANPRVYAAVRGLPGWQGADSLRRQGLILACMKKQESTRAALEGLRRHDGQQEPLIVDLRGNIVIEGNSRLAALHMLADDNPGHWGAAICRCYNDLTEEERFALVAEMHVVGKTEWTPYAKAASYWRQHHELQWDVGRIARVNRTSPAKVKTELATVELMASENVLNEHKYSWYNVLTSTKAIKQVFEEKEEFRERVLGVVREVSANASEPVERASSTFRDALTVLVKKKKPLQQFCTGRKTLQEAADQARLSGLSAKLRKVRDLLRDIDQSDFRDLSRPEFNDASSVFKRLRSDVNTVAKLFARTSKDA